MTKTVILWDWDNTLADTFPLVRAAHIRLRQHYHLPAADDTQIKQAMNYSSAVFFPRFFPDNAIEARDYFFAAYSQEAARHLKLKPSAVETLQAAVQKGYINVLASNKVAATLRAEARLLDVEKYFSKIIGSGSASQDKPSTAFLSICLEGLTYDNVWCVGDGASDIRLANLSPSIKGILINPAPNEQEFTGLSISAIYPDLETFTKKQIK